jgi:hypothetical protein
LSLAASEVTPAQALSRQEIADKAAKATVSINAISSQQVVAQATPAPAPIVRPIPTPQTRQVQQVDFLLGIDAFLTDHDYAKPSHYQPETTYFFGKRDATKAWIKNDMENDARTCEWCRTAPDLSTYSTSVRKRES